MNGFIKLHRTVFTHPIWTSGDADLFQLFIYCLFKANWKDTEVLIGNTIIPVKRGQFVTGRKTIAKDLAPTHTRKFAKYETLYRRKLFVLQSLNILTISPTSKYSIITIQNYSRYQDIDQETTKKRPSNDHQKTTAEEYKESKEYKNIRESGDKNVKNITYLTEIPPEDLSLFYKKYEASQLQIKALGEKLALWCETEGEKKKNYRSFLQNRLLDQFGYRKQDQAWTAPVEQEISPEERMRNLARLADMKKTLLGRMN